MVNGIKITKDANGSGGGAYEQIADVFPVAGKSGVIFPKYGYSKEKGYQISEKTFLDRR